MAKVSTSAFLYTDSLTSLRLSGPLSVLSFLLGKRVFLSPGGLVCPVCVCVWVSVIPDTQAGKQTPARSTVIGPSNAPVAAS